MLSFDVVDVFTDRPFAGNQLAVVHGAESLSTAQCLAIAREFNFSETTFPGAVDGSSYASRIFTPAAEIPFAGHPTLGTAWVLRERGEVKGDDVVQHCGAGEVAVTFAPDGSVGLAAAPRDLLGPLDDRLVEALLADVGLSPADLTGPVWVAGCGLTFVHLPVTEEAVRRARPSTRPLAAYADRLGGTGHLADPVEGLNVHHVSGGAQEDGAPLEGAPLEVHARVFVPGLSVPEDPATGSAAAGLGMALAVSGRLPEGGGYTVHQGAEMGRPSLLRGRVEAADGVPHRCHVAGQVRPVASGTIAVPPA